MSDFKENAISVGLLGVHLHEIDRLLELADKLTQILRIDNDALADETAFVSGALALDNVEVHVTFVVLFHVEEICSVVSDKPC